MKETTLSGQLPFDNSISDLELHSNKPVKKEYIVETLTYFFILLFAYAGVRKLVDLDMFVKEVWGFAIFGSKLAIKCQFICLASTELIVALLLSIRSTRFLGWYSAFVLVIVINISMFIMQQFAKVIPLYYGGIIPYISFIVHFIFNIVILFISLFGLLFYLEVRKNHLNTIN